MKTIFETCTPRSDIEFGHVNDEYYAADLSQVVKKTAPKEYIDPELFFQQTYPTRGLKGKSGFERVFESDRDFIAPGSDTIQELIGNEPVLILIDEVATYLRKTEAKKSNSSKQFSVFLQSLFKAIESSPNSVIVFTLAIGTKDQTAKIPVVSYIARTIFLHSLVYGETAKGISQELLKFTIATPIIGLEVDFIEKAKRLFMEEFLYLDDKPGAPLRIMTEPNLEQFIRKRQDNIDQSEIGFNSISQGKHHAT